MKRVQKTILAAAVSASTVAAAGLAPQQGLTQMASIAPRAAANTAAAPSSTIAKTAEVVVLHQDTPIQMGLDLTAPKAEVIQIATGTKKAAAKDKTQNKSKKSSKKPSYTTEWLMSQPAPKGGAEWKCLTEAIYYEARGESIKGQFAVAEVILNRSENGVYPNSICGVVKQKAGNVCQFSYRCEGRNLNMPDKRARDIAQRIAASVLDGAPRDLTKGATHYHTRAVSPSWSKKIPRTAAIGEHLFYREQRG